MHIKQSRINETSGTLAEQLHVHGGLRAVLPTRRIAARARQKQDGLAMSLTDRTSDLGEHAPPIALGRVFITDAASAALEAAQEEGVLLLARHLHGDWGDLPEPDQIQNELAVLLGLQIRSSYSLKNGKRIGIVTEADRSVTTVLLADTQQE